MRLLGWIIALSIGVAFLQVVLAVGLVAGGVILLAALLLAPKQTLSILAVLVLLGAFSAHPLAGLVFLALLIWAGTVTR